MEQSELGVIVTTGIRKQYGKVQVKTIGKSSP